jgi:Protein of unknown function (DUF3300)
MKARYLLLTVMWSFAAFGQEFDTAVPPLSAPGQRSMTDLENLVAPIALYPDPLIAIMLPAAVYPVEIVQAARFVAANNTPAALDAQIDSQNWDDNVKALARFPEVLQYMNDNLEWTVQLGDAFMDQQMDVTDAIQSLRVKAQSIGALQTTPEQIVTVTNAIVERVYNTQIIYVTNTVVQVLPSDPQVIYVPVYNPSIVFAPMPVVHPVVTFRPGVRRGGLIANRRVNWWYGGVYWGPSSFVVWSGPGWRSYPFFPPPPGWGRPAFRAPIGWVPPRPGWRPIGLPPPGLAPGRPRPGPGRWHVDSRRRSMSGSRAVASRDNRGWVNRPNRPATMSPTPGPRLTPTGRGGPGRGGVSRSSPSQMRSRNSGLSDMNSGSQSRNFGARGASSRRGRR